MGTADLWLEVEGSRMAVEIARPAGAGPFPAVIVAHHRDGVDAFTRSVGARLAEHGFLAALPNAFHRRPAGEPPHESTANLSDAGTRADISALVDHLAAHPEVKPGAIGIVGHCLGGRTAFLAAATEPRLRAAVMLYGGGVLAPRQDGGPAAIALAAGIGCPILGFFGRHDQRPSPEEAAAIDVELTRLGKRHEFRIYEDAGHAFQNRFSAERYRHASSEDAWNRLLAFLRAELG